MYILGPAHWITKFPVGNHQSPIDIQTKNAIFDQNLVNNPLKLHFTKECFIKLENTGHSFKVSGCENAYSSKRFIKNLVNEFF